MKIFTILGARPQFVKAAPVCKALKQAGHHELIVHTGQHYDHEMSQVFFEELGLSSPKFNLGVGSGNHGWQTGKMLESIERVLLDEKPELVLVYGDTNSTLAGALAAVKLHIPLAHVEAGMRSFNRQMPEEYNRILTDHCSDLLFCPTQTAADNLANEGIHQGVHWVGDTMYDAVVQYGEIAQQRSSILEKLNLQPENYLLLTVHRPYNTDNPEKLGEIIDVLRECGETVIFPVHPRTASRITEFGLLSQAQKSKIMLVEPLGYLDMLRLEQNARLILTDSGGIQKEAFFFSVPCLTLRPETEWLETVQSGWNLLVDADPSKISQGLKAVFPTHISHPAIFGDGHAAQAIVTYLGEAL